MSLRRFDFSSCALLRSTFGECDLFESRFFGCRLEGTEFFKCDLRRADFREATGYEVDVLTSRMKGARFSFPEAVNLLHSLEVTVE